MIKCRIIVKKLVKHTGGEDISKLLVKSKREFTEAEIIRIKKEMFVYNCILNSKITNPKHYEPYNLTETNKILIEDGNSKGLMSTEFLELGENDPILYFFPKTDFNIGFILRDDEGTIGHMTLSYEKPDHPDKRECNICYEFTGDEDSFVLHIYNLNSCFGKLTKTDASWLLVRWESYISFLKKLYPSADISFNFYFDLPSSNNRNKHNGILRVPIFLNKNNPNHTKVVLDFYSKFINDPHESNQSN